MTHIIVVAPNIGHYKCKTVHKDLQKCKTVQKDLHNLADQSCTMYKKLHIILENKNFHILFLQKKLHSIVFAQKVANYTFGKKKLHIIIFAHACNLIPTSSAGSN